jgi:hypothetical protein
MELLLIWQCVGIFFAALAGVVLFLYFWHRREQRRDRAIELYAILDKWGFSQLARLAKAYSIGNYLGADSVGRVTREVVEELTSGGLPAMLRKIGWKVVEGVFLKCVEDREKLVKLLADTPPPANTDPPPTTP